MIGLVLNRSARVYLIRPKKKVVRAVGSNYTFFEPQIDHSSVSGGSINRIDTRGVGGVPNIGLRNAYDVTF